MSSHVVVLDGVDKIKSSSNPQVELVVDDTVNNINDLQANKLNATAQAVDSAKLGGQSPSYYAAATGLAATTDGETALGWNGTQFKVAPAGSNSKVTFAVVGSDNVWTLDATA